MVRSPPPRSSPGCTARIPVVGVITPWNFPLLIPGVDAVPALLAGAAVLVKPSEVTPLSAGELARGWDQIGAPPVFACVTGLGATGAAVVDAVDMVQFTGSTRTGRAIAARAGERLIPCGVELGGKDPAIVLADADLSRAANGIAWGALFNSGQACISVERVYVEAPAYDRFVALLTERVLSIRQGVDNGSYSADVGPLVTRQQVEIVRSHVEDAVTRGATIATGGKATGSGGFFEPTILLDVDHSMACMRDETFGPTIPVMKVADEDEAIRLANDSHVRAFGDGVDQGHRPRTGHRAPARGRRCEHQRRLLEPVLLPPATWRLEKLRPRLAAGRPAGYPEVLPSAGHHHATGAEDGRTNCCGTPTHPGEAAPLPHCCACLWPAMSGADCLAGSVAAITRRLSPGRNRGQASAATLRADAFPPCCHGLVCWPRLPASN